MDDAEQAALRFPLQGWRVKCGLRTWLPRAKRRHLWTPMGTDIRNKGEHGYVECEIRACLKCGADDAKRIKE